MDNHERTLEAALGILKFSMMKKRYRMGKKIKKTIFQVKVLEKIFEITPLPSTQTRMDLSLLLKIPHKSIQVWFQNTRQMLRRKSSEESKGLSKVAYSCSDDSNKENDIYDIKISELLRVINEARDELQSNIMKRSELLKDKK